MEITQVTGCIVLKACEAGEYRSEEDTVCQKCPSNTIGTRRAACACPCLDGYFRNTETLTRPEALQYVGNSSEKPGNMCTKPPGAPRDLDIVAVSPNDIEINWKPPRDDGGRTDLYYQVEHRDPDNLGSYTGTVYLG
ncbi:Ephrin type-A receptor 1, partial [Geodia barretti]